MKMIVTLTGANDFARSEALRQLVANFVAEHGEFGVEQLDGEEASVERLQEALQSLPFLADRKLVIARSPSANKQFIEQAESLLRGVPDSSDVVLVEPKLDKRLAYYKLLKKATDFRDYAELDERGLAAWASDYAKEQGGTLAHADAMFLIGRVGVGQQLLRHELDKLLAYEPSITRASIELLVEPTPQSTVFELLDAAFGGRAARAFELYREQRALKVEPQAIIAMLAWQLHVLALIKSADGRSTDDIAKQAKLNPFVVRKSAGLARALSLDSLKRLIADLLALDRNLKTSAIDADEAVQFYLLALSKPAIAAF